MLDVNAADAPSGPLTALGCGLAADAGTWLAAEFVHLAAGLDHLVLVPLEGDQRLTDAHRAQLRSTIAPALAAAGFQWQSAGLHDFLQAAQSLDVQSCAPGVARQIALTQAMPSGRDGSRLRRLMTEAQMLLHEHALNTARAREGLLPANALWLWGAGQIATMRARPTLPFVLSDQPYVRGLCQMLGARCDALPRTAADLAGRSADRMMIVMQSRELPGMEQHWFAPLAQLIARGDVESADLHLDDVRIRVDRMTRLRVWRRSRPFSSWYPST